MVEGNGKMLPAGTTKPINMPEQFSVEENAAGEKRFFNKNNQQK